MKKKILILMVLLNFVGLAFAKPIDIKVITIDGKEYLNEIDDEADYFCLFASEENKQNRKIKSIQGLENLPNLTKLEFIHLDGTGDYSFLSELKNLTYLYFSGVKVNSLSFIENMKGLEIVHLDIYTDSDCYERFKKEKINCSKLKNLKEIYFCSKIKSNSFVSDRKLVPNFIKISTKPKLDLSNNDIYSFSKQDLELFSQYSVLDIRYNPVVRNDDETEKIGGNVKVIKQ